MRNRNQLETLQKQLEAQRGLYLDAEPFIPIAEALKQEVNRLIEGGDNVYPSVDAEHAFDVALQNVAEVLITERLDRMDPLQVLRMYAERAGDTALVEKLGSWATAKAKEIDALERMSDVSRVTLRTGKLVFESLEKDELLTVSLFKAMNISRSDPGSGIPPNRIVNFRLLDPVQGYAEVISDSTLAPSDSSFPIPSQVRMFVGSKVIENSSERLEPYLNVRAPLAYKVGDRIESTEEIIGFAETGNGYTLFSPRN